MNDIGGLVCGEGGKAGEEWDTGALFTQGTSLLYVRYVIILSFRQSASKRKRMFTLECVFMYDSYAILTLFSTLFVFPHITLFCYFLVA